MLISWDDIYSSSFVPLVTYDSAELHEQKIIKENRGKAGIYRWINNINGKSYVGSSRNLTIRFNVYFNKNRLEVGSGYRMAIYQAISKYGLNNFTLEILGYCCKDVTIEREQFYLDKLQPEYNLLKKAGSIFWFKHSLDAEPQKKRWVSELQVVSFQQKLGLKIVKLLKAVNYRSLQKKRLGPIDTLKKLS